MFKLIWSRQEYEQLTTLLYPSSVPSFEVVLANDASEVSPQQIGILYPKDAPEQAELLAKAIALIQPRLLFETADGWIVTSLVELAYFESFGNELMVHRSDASSFMVREPLYQLEKLLTSYHFIRVGKSFVVSLAAIQRIRIHWNAKLLLELDGGHTVEVSRSYVPAFKQAIGIGKKEKTT